MIDCTNPTEGADVHHVILWAQHVYLRMGNVVVMMSAVLAATVGVEVLLLIGLWSGPAVLFLVLAGVLVRLGVMVRAWFSPRHQGADSR